MLKNFVSLYVPGTYGLAGSLSEDKQAAIANETAKRLSSAFGGATSFPATGYYVADDDHLVRETIIIVKAYHDKDIDSALLIATDIAAWIKSLLQQEAVTIETESGMQFV